MVNERVTLLERFQSDLYEVCKQDKNRTKATIMKPSRHNLDACTNCKVLIPLNKRTIKAQKSHEEKAALTKD